MIGYRISLAQLESLIDAEVTGWRTRADDRTKKFKIAGKYDEPSTIWSEIKVVYMRLQGEAKCVYCERKLEGEERGKAEHDVEHFRPKSSVRTWKISAALSKQGVSLTQPGKPAPGYHLLPYHLFNYSAACKPCNSAIKSDCFPIAGTYQFTGDDPIALLGEQPLLVYPIGDFDHDPEELIGFHGISPQAIPQQGYKRHKALTTIAFFELDDPIGRKNLVRGRAHVITTLYPQLLTFAGNESANKKAIAKMLIDGFTSPKSEHTNCARSFRTLFNADPDEAERIFEAAARFIDSSS